MQANAFSACPPSTCERYCSEWYVYQIRVLRMRSRRYLEKLFEIHRVGLVRVYQLKAPPPFLGRGGVTHLAQYGTPVKRNKAMISPRHAAPHSYVLFVSAAPTVP